MTTIEIIIYKDGIEDAKREAENWEVAEHNFESLKNLYQNKEAEKEQELADLSDEE